MTEKRFKINMEHECIDDAKEEIFIDFNDKIDFHNLCEFLNKLSCESEQLKQENMEYHRIFNCRTCKHLDYDWHSDGEEFEVCDKRNTDRMLYNRFCKDWERS